MPTPQTSPFSRRRLVRVGFIGLVAMAGVWLGLAAVAFSAVAPDSLHVFFLGLSGAGLGVMWMILVAVALGSPPGGRMSRAWLTLALATPLCGLVGVLMLVTDWDLRLRVALSQQALAQEADRVRQLPDGREADERQIGLFRVKYATVTDDGVVRFVTGWPWMFDEVGLYHDPSRTLTPTREWPEHRNRLIGPWVAFHLHD